MSQALGFRTSGLPDGNPSAQLPLRLRIKAHRGPTQYSTAQTSCLPQLVPRFHAGLQLVVSQKRARAARPLLPDDTWYQTEGLHENALIVYWTKRLLRAPRRHRHQAP